MAKNILGPDDVIKAFEIQRRLAVGYQPFFRIFASEDILSKMPLGKLATGAIDNIRAAIKQIKAVYGGNVIPSKSSISRLNQLLTEIEDAKNQLLGDPMAKTILTAKSYSLPLPVSELNYNIKFRKGVGEIREKGVIGQALSALGLSTGSAIGLGAAAQVVAPALGPFFGVASTAVGAARLLAKPTMWAGRMLGKGIGALAGVSLANRGGWRPGGGWDRGGRSRSALGGSSAGIEQFLQRPMEPQAPMAGLGQPTAGGPMPTAGGPTDLSSAGRMLAMARWGKKDASTGGQPTSYEYSKNLEYFFDKRAYKARWTRDVAGYLKALSGGVKVDTGMGVLGGAVAGIKDLFKNPLKALGLVGLMKSFKDLLPILGKVGKALGLVGAVAFTTYELWRAAKAMYQLHKAREQLAEQDKVDDWSWNRTINRVKSMGLEEYARKQGISPEKAMENLVSSKRAFMRVKDEKNMGALAYIPGINNLLPWLKDKDRTKSDIEDQIKKELGLKRDIDRRQFEEKLPGGVPDYDKLVDTILKQNEESKKQTDKLDGIKNAIEKQGAKPQSALPRPQSQGSYDSADPLLNLLNYHGAWPIS